MDSYSRETGRRFADHPDDPAAGLRNIATLLRSELVSDRAEAAKKLLEVIYMNPQAAEPLEFVSKVGLGYTAIAAALHEEGFFLYQHRATKLIFRPHIFGLEKIDHIGYNGERLLLADQTAFKGAIVDAAGEIHHVNTGDRPIDIPHRREFSYATLEPHNGVAEYFIGDHSNPDTEIWSDKRVIAYLARDRLITDGYLESLATSLDSYTLPGSVLPGRCVFEKNPITGEERQALNAAFERGHWDRVLVDGKAIYGTNPNINYIASNSGLPIAERHIEIAIGGKSRMIRLPSGLAFWSRDKLPPPENLLIDAEFVQREWRYMRREIPIQMSAALRQIAKNNRDAVLEADRYLDIYLTD